MIVIYTQDETFIRNDTNAAKSILIDVYGEKLGNEAYATIKNAREGTIYRMHGGPRVEVVSKDKARWISDRESKIGIK